jgi:hypothetical protein
MTKVPYTTPSAFICTFFTVAGQSEYAAKHGDEVRHKAADNAIMDLDNNFRISMPLLQISSGTDAENTAHRCHYA